VESSKRNEGAIKMSWKETPAEKFRKACEKKLMKEAKK